MKYIATAKYEDATLTCESWTCAPVIIFLLEHAENGAQVDIIDGLTGEVLCAQNCEDPYMQDDFALLLMGWMAKESFCAMVQGLGE
jgi:hypothetical protein